MGGLKGFLLYKIDTPGEQKSILHNLSIGAPGVSRLIFGFPHGPLGTLDRADLLWTCTGRAWGLSCGEVFCARGSFWLVPVLWWS